MSGFCKSGHIRIHVGVNNSRSFYILTYNFMQKFLKNSEIAKYYEYGDLLLRSGHICTKHGGFSSDVHIMYIPDVVSGAKTSTCPWCDDKIRWDDNNLIKLFTFLSSLRDKADKQKSK